MSDLGKGDEFFIYNKTWNKLYKSSTKSGYRDGIDEGRNSKYQDNFDKGYKEGFKNGFVLGFYKGVFSTNEAIDDEKLQKVSRGNCNICKNTISLQEDSIIKIIDQQNESTNTILLNLRNKINIPITLPNL